MNPTVSTKELPQNAEMVSHSVTHGQECGIEIREVAGGVCAFVTKKSPAREGFNEDSIGVISFGETAGLLIVADGVGGVKSGEIASSTVVESIQNSVEELYKSVDPTEPPPENSVLLRSAIVNGIEEANRKILSLGIGCASTVSVIEIQNDTVRPLHVGDSSILVTGLKGKIKLQTINHSPVGFAIESGLLEDVEALHHEVLHIVSNVVGDDEMRIEIGSPLKMAKRDTVVLASDGLFDNLYQQEIIELGRKGKLPNCMDRLLDLTSSRMLDQQDETPSKPDDLSVILFRRKWTRAKST